jgi:hypothetical protein
MGRLTNKSGTGLVLDSFFSANDMYFNGWTDDKDGELAMSCHLVVEGCHAWPKITEPSSCHDVHAPKLRRWARTWTPEVALTGKFHAVLLRDGLSAPTLYFESASIRSLENYRFRRKIFEDWLYEITGRWNGREEVERRIIMGIDGDREVTS